MQRSSYAKSSAQGRQLQEQVELLKKHESNSARLGGHSRDSHHHLAGAPTNGHSQHRGYRSQSPTSPYSTRAAPRQESLIHPDLRVHSSQTDANMMPMVPQSAHSPGAAHGNPAIAPAPPTGSSPDESPSDGRKAKRELSQSKRAAQNRAAQRAFRQRKEYYIKKLEQQVREFMDMEQSYKTMQTENYALREYVIHLQSRLLDAQGEYPQPPPNINLSQPPSAAQGQSSHPPMSQARHPSPPSHHQPSTGSSSAAAAGSGTGLEAVAQAVVGMQNQEHMQDRAEGRYGSAYGMKRESSHEDMRSAEEINRHLQSAEAPGHD